MHFVGPTSVNVSSFPHRVLGLVFNSPGVSDFHVSSQIRVQYSHKYPLFSLQIRFSSLFFHSLFGDVVSFSFFFFHSRLCGFEATSPRGSDLHLPDGGSG